MSNNRGPLFYYDGSGVVNVEAGLGTVNEREGDVFRLVMGNMQYLQRFQNDM